MNSTYVALLACVVCLSACSDHSNMAANVDNGVQEDRQGQELLASSPAPSTPKLEISSDADTLLLQWQVTQPGQQASVYQYNTLTGEETLISDSIALDQQSLSIASRTALREWHADQFRVELCVAADCVSSERVAIDSLVESTIQTLAPSVFLRGERFAEFVTANYDASVVATSLATRGAVQMHFRVNKQWFSNKSVGVIDEDYQELMHLDISATGDTVAVLLSDTSTTEDFYKIRLVERLGERWAPATSFTSALQADENTALAFKLSADGDKLLLGTDTSLDIFYRDGNWTRHSVLTPDANGHFIAATMNANFNTLFTVEKQTDAIWLKSYSLVAKEAGAEWVETSRLTVQGIDPSDEALLQSSADASSVMLAGWAHSNATQRTPVIWRYSVSTDTAVSLSALDTIQLMPTEQHNAALRFSANDRLDTVVFGWQSEPDDDALLATFTYDMVQREWRKALEIPANMPLMAKQGFAGDVQFSGDGSTLLLAVPANNAVPYVNVGAVLVIR